MSTPRPDWEGNRRWAVTPPSSAEVDAALARRVIAMIEADPALAARLHQASDVDSSRLALHHTLGTAPLAAAAGDHSHGVLDLNNITRVWSVQTTAAATTIVLATAETKETNWATSGDMPITTREGYSYLFMYRARFQFSAVPSAADARIRFRLAGTGPVVNTDSQAVGFSVPVNVAAGGGAVSFNALALLTCGGDINQGDWNVAAFYDVTAGGGTLSVDQPSGTQRQLAVIETVGSNFF